MSCPLCRALWPEARSSERAALRLHPCTSDTAAPAPKHSDDRPPVPWCTSASRGTSVYLQRQPPGIPPDLLTRKPYYWPDRPLAPPPPLAPPEPPLPAPPPPDPLAPVPPEPSAPEEERPP